MISCIIRWSFIAIPILCLSQPTLAISKIEVENINFVTQENISKEDYNKAQIEINIGKVPVFLDVPNKGEKKIAILSEKAIAEINKDKQKDGDIRIKTQVIYIDKYDEYVGADLSCEVPISLTTTEVLYIGLNNGYTIEKK